MLARDLAQIVCVVRVAGLAESKHAARQEGPREGRVVSVKP